MRSIFKTLCASTAFVLSTSALGPAHAEVLFEATSEQAHFRVERIADGMDFPWDMEVLPDGEILISEYAGGLRSLPVGGALSDIIPTSLDVTSNGGLRGIAAHPDFDRNRLMYFCFASGTPEANSTHIARGTYSDGAISNVERIFEAANQARQLAHYGCRLLFASDRTLIATFGDRRHHQTESQSLKDHYGVAIRINDDGSIPADNPFIDVPDARPEIYAYGIRNAQGAAFHPDTGEIWFADHGPLGGDEINILRSGVNYGWPIATFGIDYSGEELTDTPLLNGVEPPLFYWYPSTAPSSMAFYTGTDFPKWRGDAFVTSLRDQRLLRLELNGDRILRVEPLLSDLDVRLRNVEMGPDGALYVLTDSGDGRLLRITPVGE